MATANQNAKQYHQIEELVGFLDSGQEKIVSVALEHITGLTATEEDRLSLLSFVHYLHQNNRIAKNKKEKKQVDLIESLCKLAGTFRKFSVCI